MSDSVAKPFLVQSDNKKGTSDDEFFPTEKNVEYEESLSNRLEYEYEYESSSDSDPFSQENWNNNKTQVPENLERTIIFFGKPLSTLFVAFFSVLLAVILIALFWILLGLILTFLTWQSNRPSYVGFIFICVGVLQVFFSLGLGAFFWTRISHTTTTTTN